MRRRYRVGLGLLSVVVVVLLIKTLADAGVFLTIEPSGPEPLRIVEGFAGGTEDLVFRPNWREVFISSADFRDPTAPGHIYLLDVTDPDATPRDVTPKGLHFSLQPHGIDLVTDGGDEFLFVVNHRNGSGFAVAAGDLGQVSHTIEVFRVGPTGDLTHHATHRDPAIRSPNDVAAVGPASFYVTNDHRFEPGFLRTLEDWLKLPVGDVVYCETDACRQVITGTRYANGVAVTVDPPRVYVSETTGGRISSFERALDGTLTRVNDWRGVNGADNLSIGPNGDIWTAAHPKLLAFLAHSANAERRSPSQVLRILPGSEDLDVVEVYLNDGDPLSGSSVAASNGELTVVGAVFESRVVILPIRHQ